MRNQILKILKLKDSDCPGIWKTKGPKGRGERFQSLFVFDGQAYFGKTSHFTSIFCFSRVETNTYFWLNMRKVRFGAHYGTHVEWYRSTVQVVDDLCFFCSSFWPIFQLPGQFLSMTKSYQLPLFDPLRGLQRSPQVVVYLACLSLVKMWVKDLDREHSSDVRDLFSEMILNWQCWNF